MNSIPDFSEEDVRRQVGDAALQRGRRTLRERVLGDLRLQGNSLKAVCTGTAPDPYRIQAEFDASGLTTSRCSCPVGHEGNCKHVAALLLAWLQSPETFARLEPLDEALARLGRDELIHLLRQMLRQQPELEGLLERSLHAREQVPADPETYRREAAALFARGNRDWSAEAGIAERLEALVEIGTDLQRREDAAGATAVYEGVAVAIVERQDSIYDDEGRISGILKRCIQSLGQLGPAAQALYRIYGTAVGRDAELAEHEVREALGDETLLRLCADEGWSLGRMRRLIQLGRLDEAHAMLDEIEDADRIPLAELCQHSESPASAQLASRLYRAQIESWIGMRGREKYREVRQLLERMRPLEERLVGGEGFAGYLGALRDRHRALRALIEELDAAGLGGN